MKITFLYNPTAGEKELQVDTLVKGLHARGAEVIIQSTKDDDYEKVLDLSPDFVIIAGGDGTVEKLTKKLVDKNIPIAILPAGSANNIANSLNVEATLDGIINSWHSKNFCKFSMGMVVVEQNKDYFLESVGWGLFSEVLSKTKTEKKNQKKNSSSSQKDKVESGLDKLSQSLEDLQASYIDIFLDGKDYSGDYLWVEIMNTQSMGPQLKLAPEAKAGDDFLDVVLVKEDEREILKEFIDNQSEEGPNPYFKTIKSKQIKVKTSETFHIDDEIHKGVKEDKRWAKISLFYRYFWVINA